MTLPSKKSSAPEFRELITPEEWTRAFPVLQEFRPTLKLDGLLALREHLQENHYHLFALFVGDRVVSVVGVVVAPHILRGSELRVNDLATLSSEQSKGYGSLMLDRVRDFAAAYECSRILLYSQLSNANAHRFYENKVGYKRYGIEFVLEVDSRDNQHLQGRVGLSPSSP